MKKENKTKSWDVFVLCVLIFLLLMVSSLHYSFATRCKTQCVTKSTKVITEQTLQEEFTRITPEELRKCYIDVLLCRAGAIGTATSGNFLKEARMQAIQTYPDNYIYYIMPEENKTLEYCGKYAWKGCVYRYIYRKKKEDKKDLIKETNEID